MLEKTKINTNTQKVEASNRSMRRSIPKNVTFSRNFPGRSHSAAHNINHGPGESIYHLCKVVGSPISPGTRVSRALKQQQNINDCHKRRKKKQKKKKKNKKKQKKKQKKKNKKKKQKQNKTKKNKKQKTNKQTKNNNKTTKNKSIYRQKKQEEAGIIQNVRNTPKRSEVS